MSTELVRVAHLSLKFSATPDQKARYIGNVIAAERLDLVDCTEAKGSAATVRKHLGPQWRVSARGEYLVCSRREVLARWHGWPTRLRTVKGADWTNGPHAGTRRFQVQFTNLKYRPVRKRLRVMALHAPSHVQIGTSWRSLPNRVNPYQRGMSALGRWTSRCHHNVTQLLTLDSNLEQHLEVWRDYLEEETGLPSIWHASRPAGGTEGRRLIDTAHTNGRVSNARELHGIQKDPIFDHVGIAFDLELV